LTPIKLTTNSQNLQIQALPKTTSCQLAY
jgi:hypothetical protein